ncbi:hypothetical protein ACFX2J_044241 [Malus domestica]
MTAAALEVYTTRFIVFAFKHAFGMPRAPSIDLLVTTSSGYLSWKSTGVATWNTPMHPSTTALKLSGLQRSALKILSLSVAPGRLVR